MRLSDPIVLSTDQADVRLHREGGCIARYRLLDGSDGAPFDLMRPMSTAPGEAYDPLSCASFPLVPYFSRIRDGRFRFDGGTYQLPLNFGDHPHSLHGTGWQARWELAEADTDRAELTLDARQGGWPFPFHARQTFTLAGPALHHEIALTNSGAGPMPAGLGMHPFFPRHDGARVQAAVDAVWRYDDNFLPTARVPCPPEWDLRTGRDVAALDCDTVFEGWDGRARITWPNRGVDLRIEADASLNRLVVYAPADADIFCVEPVSQITDAFNRAAAGAPETETGMRILAPGETWTAGAWFRPGT